MNAIPSITESLSNAYFRTKFQIFLPEITIELSARCGSIALYEIHKSFNVSTSAIVTAYNPYGQLTDRSINELNQQKLEDEVTQYWDYLPADGSDPGGEWPAEPSLLILGIPLEEALTLGRRFKQHAIFFASNSEDDITSEWVVDGDLYASWPEHESLLLHPLERMDIRLRKRFEESGLEVRQLDEPRNGQFTATFIPRRSGEKSREG